jgi:hypothetical protein
MDTFARTPELRARIAAGRTEVTRHFWRWVGSLFGRRA